ncbi:response regulator transcription factor [Streptomyces sp. DSM 40750]|uniref:response regulator transcription factor n=1 Tax=Streptomyces sp. DSM 40750 TaxID=2801030 RepID=UPI00214ACD22|nr:response regulator transcription factor [Streptomyces sp. DSM 40750]UUU25581.1 response regulator transcription factor [Streptomyces sp. DSM 40750]
MGTPPTSVSSGDRTTRVLVAHEKLSQALLLYRHLRSAGIRVALPRLGASVPTLRQIQEQAPDAVLLAVTRTRARWDAVALARALRREPARPGILFLTGDDSGSYRAADLSLADDYVPEGCPPAELALRVEVLLRRRSAPGFPAPVPSGLRVVPESRRVLLHGREVGLTATEFDILHLLVEQAGKVVPKGEILDRVWHHDFNGESNIVEAYICTLRRKLADSDRTLISTVRGVGYLLAAPEAAPESLNPFLRITVPAAAEVVIASPTA